MIPFPDIRPYLFKIGPFQLRWYGLMYLFGFASSYFLVRRAVRKRNLPLTDDTIGSLYTWGILGLILGARLGYVIIYKLPYYLAHPLAVFAVWEGGMSFHGGLIGSVLAGVLFARKHGIRTLMLSDLVMATAPTGLFFGRLGNFINGELYGRVTTVPWGMVFPGAATPEGNPPRHPSQLYEAACEGVLLFCVLWLVLNRAHREGTVTGLFLILYGLMRFGIEFFREPDAHLGLVAGPFTMGQVLCGAMVLLGALILSLSRRPERSSSRRG
jgi:phosphatidylglycerol:prolipoprotein diacylglycerol transferase